MTKLVDESLSQVGPDLKSLSHQNGPDLKSLRQKAAQLREYHESKIKSKFEENKTYFIVNCETIKTKYGPTFVITTDEGERYFANKKVSKYMEDNHLTISNFKPFGINTYNYKTFVNENGEKIIYLELQIFNSEIKVKKSVKPTSWPRLEETKPLMAQTPKEAKPTSWPRLEKESKPINWANTLKSLSQVVQDSEEFKSHK